MLINLKAIAPQVSDSDLAKLSSDNPEAKFETDSEGHLIVISPTGSNGAKLGWLIDPKAKQKVKVK